jgi:hypothetical protein
LLGGPKRWRVNRRGIRQSGRHKHLSKRPVATTTDPRELRRWLERNIDRMKPLTRFSDELMVPDRLPMVWTELKKEQSK